MRGRVQFPGASIAMKALTAIAFVTIALPVPSATAQSAAPVVPGVYSDSQASRGQLWFESQCMACHPQRDMASPDFQVKWKGLTALDLFDRISNTMPLTSPGSLSRRTYVDIVAYLLKINGLPAGTTALAADSAAMKQAMLAFSAP